LPEAGQPEQQNDRLSFSFAKFCFLGKRSQGLSSYLQPILQHKENLL
jgi:hypothetical protein